MRVMTIIAAIDFTPVSSDVARLAAGLARKLGDKLLLLHVVEPSIPPYESTGSIPLPMPWPVDTAPAVESREQSIRRMREALARQGLEIETRIVAGPPDRTIEATADEVDARLIVAGTHGRGPVGRLLVGSVAQRLLLRAHCPVLVIREGGGAAIERWLLGERPLRVVAGVDRKGAATDSALDWLRQLGALGPFEITLVHEYWPPAEYSRLGMRGPRDLFETDPEVAAILERELELKVGTFAWAPNARVRARAAWGSIGEALAREATSAAADLVVVGSDQPHGWERLKRGSAAVSTLHAVVVPLLCVPARGHRGAAARNGERPVVAPALRSVLAATDLSEVGNAAVAQAYALLRAEGGVVHLCHVAEGSLPSPSYAYAPEAGPLTVARDGDLEAQLRRLIPAEATELEIATRVSVIDGGEPAEQIAAAALQVGADAIVLGSHGRTGLKRAVLGSVAEAVLRHAEMPVYVVRRPPA
jgi:nucleotide-binding universal stress UspA family protein